MNRRNKYLDVVVINEMTYPDFIKNVVRVKNKCPTRVSQRSPSQYKIVNIKTLMFK